jgi:alkylated DNA repair dioxygenase AlkB
MNCKIRQQGFVFSDRTELQHSFGFKEIPLPDADVALYPSFFSETESIHFLQHLLTQTKWRHDRVKFYGKEINLPRLTAWFGDLGKSYTYSKIEMDSLPWTPQLLEIKNRVEAATIIPFNCVLLNLYRDGNDGVAWHADDEPELGNEPTIASVSFGQTRKFQLRHRFNKEIEKVEIPLTDGSLLLMKGKTQQFWQHQIPKTSKPVGLRINLTFRIINT